MLNTLLILLISDPMASEKVLVTGATGFIGSELVVKLLDGGCEVHTLERNVAERYDLALSNRAVPHTADLTDYQTIQAMVDEIQPEYVIHTAAVSAVSYSYDHYIEISDVDYVATINLAEACHRSVKNFKQFIFSGSSEEYGTTLENVNQRLTEDSELNPNSPYALAKVASDHYLRYMYRAYKFPYTIIRGYNTYGRRNNRHFFIEKTISQMLSGADVRLGDPTPVRDWLYVDDHVDGFMASFGNKKSIGQTIQLCTGNGYTTRATAELIAKLTGFRGEIKWNSLPKRPIETQITIGDNAKAQELLGWKPKYTLEEGLKKTIENYKNAETQ
jgi:nucleoside-diphosphate-sugar epimerase